MTKENGKYSVIQMGTSPFDLLFDVRIGINEVWVYYCDIYSEF